jgi:hypothetical protein
MEGQHRPQTQPREKLETQERIRISALTLSLVEAGRVSAVGCLGVQTVQLVQPERVWFLV